MDSDNESYHNEGEFFHPDEILEIFTATPKKKR